MQLDLLGFGRHGGKRERAGRRRDPRSVSHQKRPRVRNAVLHVTSRIDPAVKTLRTRSLVRAIEGCMRVGCERDDFRVTHYSLQKDHVHYIVETSDGRALARGMRGLHVRIARAVNRVLRRRGRVFAQRFHVQRSTSPRQVRHAIRYVLSNAQARIGALAGRAAGGSRVVGTLVRALDDRSLRRPGCTGRRPAALLVAHDRLAAAGQN